MSDELKHECGIALLRLRKPLEYYKLKYGTWMWGINKLYLLMEKQHNRGQDGAGAACIKLDLQPGKKYIHRFRSNSQQSIQDVFSKIHIEFEKVELRNPNLLNDPHWAKENLPFAGELFLGHLRYGTFGKNNIENVHPVMRENNWKSRNLVVAGNFNLTNVNELFEHLKELGQHPKDYSDTVTVLEKIGHFLDKEVERVFEQKKYEGLSNVQISEYIAKNLNIKKILNEASWRWDGGFVVAGMVGHGDSFVMRDPWGIRPAFYYYNDEIAVVTSERPVIQTVFNAPIDKIKEVKPGYAVIIKNNNTITEEKIIEPYKKSSCSFERIYFSRGTDRDIYNERKELGRLIAPTILKSINYDVENTVFSYIPNTAAVAFYGLTDAINKHYIKIKKEKIFALGNNITQEALEKFINLIPRIESLAVKDIKLRTFITQDAVRKDLVEHVYDVTYGIVRDFKDTLVVIDDSIVRGTTLKESILRMLDRLNPKKIIVVSSAPQIRYPDCYGIDMAKLSDFVAFQAAIELLKENGKQSVINEVYNISKEQQNKPKEEIVNYIKLIYKPFTADEISEKITQLLKPKDIKADIKIIYNSIENLRKAIPNHTGDWYFTGDYPTPGGNMVVNNSFINYIEGRNQRAY
ncbi:MAG: amidophosphoribosyltransferase [Bacteroidetes bacterium CG02_land_8_20_14_3_00_31_25]|nr:amidophosphoribosyltransferase [Bacteroidota bacterium]PIV63285.1 MAG: amidophosphoribosyltransferase [Bacteroidetes bacterium CG02_land_8_20_14_3_00_31_25]